MALYSQVDGVAMHEILKPVAVQPMWISRLLLAATLLSDSAR
jgi:hypothetical protein